MKTALKILSLALVAMLFSSCSQKAIYYDASGNAAPGGTSISSKGTYVAAPVVASPAPKKVWRSCSGKTKKQKCTKRLSSYCPDSGCGGVVGDAVLSRATMQGATGEPQLGLIPTMKTLAP